MYRVLKTLICVIFPDVLTAFTEEYRFGWALSAIVEFLSSKFNFIWRWNGENILGKSKSICKGLLCARIPF